LPSKPIHFKQIGVMPKFNIIVAVDEDFGIGKNGQMPWHLRADLKHFRKITTTAPSRKTNAVIMGRKTWESIPTRFRPLDKRINLVLSRKKLFNLPKDVFSAESFQAGLDLVSQEHARDIGAVFVIGGAQVYKTALMHPECQNIFLTKIYKNFKCDTFFPNQLNDFRQSYRSPLKTEDDLTFRFTRWTRNSA